MGGSIGSAQVEWSVRSDTKDDIVLTAGSVQFVDGQTSATIGIRIRGDRIPELDERFTIVLKAVSKVRGHR